MSWHFLQEQEEAFWEGNSLDGAPSALLSLIPKPAAHSSHDNAMASCHDSQSGMTCEPLMELYGENASMSSVGDSPAPTSALLGNVPASKAAKAGSGWKWRASFAKYDPDTRSWKMPQASLLEGSEPFSEIWPKWGWMRAGECSEQTIVDSTIGANDSGLLPTPSGVNAGRNHTIGRLDEWGGSSNPFRGTAIGSLSSPEFEELVMGWPVTWTARTPLEMARFQQWLRMHGDFFSTADTSSEKQT